MDLLYHEIRVALRSLFRRPTFALVAVATLAIGIGANTIMLSVAHGVLLRPLPYPESERLVNVFRLAEDVTGMNPSNANIARLYSVPYPLYLDWAERGRVFEDIGGYAGDGYTVTGAEFPLRAEGVQATSGVFAALGVDAALGRTFTPDDDRVGAPAQVIVSHGFWGSYFGNDPSALGDDLVLNGTPYTIVGVMPAGFAFPDAETELWVRPEDDLKQQTFRPGGNLQVIARLRPGVSVSDAQREMDGVARSLGELHPEEREHGVRVVGNQELIVAATRPTLYLFAGALALVLVVVCANLAGLLLVRGLERRQEIAVRAALGAGRGRLVMHVLTEGLALSTLGGLAGLGLAAAGIGPFLDAFPGRLPRAGEIGLDLSVFVIAVGLVIATGLLTGIVPALRLAADGAAGTLRGSDRSTAGGGGHSRAQAALVVAQVAIAFALLVGAVAFVTSFMRLTSDELGFNADGVVTMRIVLPGPYSDPVERSAQFFRDLEQRVAAIPGVQSVGRTSQAPFVDGLSAPPTEIETDGEIVSAAVHSSTVTPEYFDSVGIPLVRGRLFTEADRQGSPPAALVNEAFARTYWPDQDPIGRRVRLNLADDDPRPWLTVVGVVADVRYRYGNEPFPEFYIPYAQDNVYYQTLLLRTTLAPAAIVEAARASVRDVNPEVFAHIGVYAEAIEASSSLAGPRFGARAIGSLGIIAALLAVLGIYAVLASAVVQRRREIGIRMALGARRETVVRGVLQRGLRLGGAGLVLGVGITLAASRLIGGLLYQTSPADTSTLAAVAMLLIAAAMVASYLPARRATRVSLVEVLRGE